MAAISLLKLLWYLQACFCSSNVNLNVHCDTVEDNLSNPSSDQFISELNFGKSSGVNSEPNEQSSANNNFNCDYKHNEDLEATNLYSNVDDDEFFKWLKYCGEKSNISDQSSVIGFADKEMQENSSDKTTIKNLKRKLTTEPAKDASLDLIDGMPLRKKANSDNYQYNSNISSFDNDLNSKFDSESQVFSIASSINSQVHQDSISDLKLQQMEKLNKIKKHAKFIKQRLYSIRLQISKAFENNYDEFNYIVKFLIILKNFIVNQLTLNLKHNFITQEIQENSQKINSDLSDFIYYLKTEIFKCSSRKSVGYLSLEFMLCTQNIRKYLSKFCGTLVSDDVIVKCCEVCESYLNAILKYENILVSGPKIIERYFNNEYKIKTYNLDGKIHLFNKKFYSFCMDSENIFTLYGNFNKTSESNIFKLSRKEESEVPNIYTSYITKDSKDNNNFRNFCKRILIDSEGKLYILHMEIKSEILILNQKLEQVDLINSKKIQTDSSVSSINVADICLYDDKIYLLDSNNSYIYCYNIKLEYQNKIKIPGDFYISRLHSCFSISQNYIFVADKGLFFVFNPKTGNFLEMTKLLNINSLKFTSLSDGLIAVIRYNCLYLFKFQIEEIRTRLKLTFIERISVLPKAFERSENFEMLRSPDGKLNLITYKRNEIKFLRFSLD